MDATGTGKHPSVSSKLSTQSATTTTTSPSVPQTTPALLPVFYTETARAHPSPPATAYRLRSILISLLQVVSVSILIVIGFVTLLGLPLALCATMGVIIILTGNAPPRTLVPQDFTNNTSAAFIGVVGSLILSPPLYILHLRLIPRSPDYWDQCISGMVLTIFVFPPYSTVIGLIGSSVLLYCRVDLGGIDISNASIAGFFGGLLLIVPALVGFRFFPLLLSFIISSIWSEIMRGIKWIHINLTKTWMHRSHSHSYGSREDDPEIITELQIPPGRG